MDNKHDILRPEHCLHQLQQLHPSQQLPNAGVLPITSGSTVPLTSIAAHFPTSIALQPIDMVNSIVSASQSDQRILQQFDASLTAENGSVPQMMTIQPGDLANIGNIINEKVAIYRHPLFPLLRILFEKCEVATNSIETVNSITFDHEIKSFITQMAKENKPFFTEDAEVDGLMLKSLQVLRIHLLELEKVNELCKDFCTRYISCLKGKLNSENIMRTLDITNSPPESPNETSQQKIHSSIVFAETSTTQVVPSLTETITQNVESVGNHVLNQEHSRSMSTSFLQESKPESEAMNLTARAMSIDTAIGARVNNISVSDLTSGFLSKKNKCGKRGVLPKQATNVLKAWLFQHLVHPYPSEDEKKQLAIQTNLSNLQVNNWFINARRRILQPMLETTNSFLKNNKKSKQQRNAAHKDWKNSIGVYNAYRTEALQTHAMTSSQQQQVGFVIDSRAQPTTMLVDNRAQPTAMLVNLPDGQTHPVVLTQPLQFIQVSQVPIQAMSNGYIPMAQTVSTQAPVMTTVQQPMVPLLSDQKRTDLVSNSTQLSQ